MNFTPFLSELEVLHDCTVCPRNCHADRFTSKLGYCRTGTGFHISSICIHQGEEPVISGSKGICNIFFTHCNLQCTYCQNYQISDNSKSDTCERRSLTGAVRQITSILDTGINIVGFVSPSHVIPQMKILIRSIESMGYHPTWVYNSNGYDKVETLGSLEGIIDVYLPDMKYMDEELAGCLSGAKDYPETAVPALKEMVRQKGTALIINSDGYAESGILVRHLVLPGHTDNSLQVLRSVAEEISPRLHIGLMSQYHPAYKALTDPKLGRTLTRKEYESVIREMKRLGMTKGFIQDLSSFNHYLPDFNKNHPFESE